MSTGCTCRFCTRDYPEYQKMMHTDDIDELRRYASRMFENWQMEKEDLNSDGEYGHTYWRWI